MVSVTDRSLRSYTRQAYLEKRRVGLQAIDRPRFPLADYREWHAGEVEGLPRLSERIR